MEIRPYTADDVAVLTQVVELYNAAGKIDCPWVHPATYTTVDGFIRNGWDGELPLCFGLFDGDRLVADSRLWLFVWDNTDQAWVDLMVHPDERRRGHGSRLLEHLVDGARRRDRTIVGSDAWDTPTADAFARKHGFEPKSRAINRRQYVAEQDADELHRIHAEAADAASDYELLRITGRTPEELLPAMSAMTESINDAPTDDLEIDDELFPVERIVAYEDAVHARRERIHRVVARHRGSHDLAGHTIVAVEEERPQIGHQHDTTVVRAHRGHRLGLLLKSDMLLWLAETEPQLATVDTWNAESNDHMIAVNERLGYKPLGRGIQYQRHL
jgi:GNAT superfamily N-acetyltransferase